MIEIKNGVFRVAGHSICIVMFSFSKKSIFALRDLFIFVNIHVELSVRLVNAWFPLLNVNI